MKKYITKQSSIKGAGKGLFTNASFKKGEVIGLAHVNGQPTKEVGSNHNHNEKNPTANNIKNGNKRYLIASRNLKPGEEITTNYRLQPELEQPEDFKKKKDKTMTPQKDGYRTYSPFKNLPYIDVESDTIDSDNIVYDLKLRANNGLTKFIKKNTGLHTLPGAKVIREIPVKRKGGALLTKKVTCKSCGWEWDAEDGGKDITTCHKCGGQGLIHAQKGGESKCLNGQVWSKKDKKCIDLPVFGNSLNSGTFTKSTNLSDGFKIKPLNSFSDFGKIKPKKIPVIKDNFLETLEKDINDFLDNPKAKAAQLSESLADKDEVASDALRHSTAGALAAQTIANKTGNIPFISNPLGYLGANIAGIGHELSTLSQAYLDDRPWSVKLQESLEDIYNNSVGANTIFNNNSEKDKINYLLKLTRTNQLPDGYGEERPFRHNPKWTDPYNQKQYGGINKFVDGGKPCPKGEYWNGTKCVKIPKNTRIVYHTDKDVYDKAFAAESDSSHFYNNAKSDFNKFDKLGDRFSTHMSDEEWQKTNDQYFKLLNSQKKKWHTDEYIGNIYTPNHTVNYKYKGPKSGLTIKPVGLEGFYREGYRFPRFKKPVIHNVYEEPIVEEKKIEEKIENLPLLKPGLIDPTKDELQGNTLNEEELELPNEEVESEYLKEGSPDTENPMEWVNKRKYDIDWNGIQIPYRLPRFRKPGSYGDLIKPGKKRYINLPTIESRNTAYLRPKRWQDGGNTDAMTGMMKARLAYANEFGNPAAERMINLPDNPYQFDNGDTGTHYMASMDNYAVPQIQDENGVLQLGDYGPESNEAIRFDSDEDANYFAENYKDVSPGFIEADLDEDEIEEYRRGGYIVEEIDTYQKGGTVYTVKGSKGNYKKVNGKWQVDWNKSGKYQPLSKGDIKARTAVLNKMAKPINDGMSKVSSNSSDNTRVNNIYQKPLDWSFDPKYKNNTQAFVKKSSEEKEKAIQKEKEDNKIKKGLANNEGIKETVGQYNRRKEKYDDLDLLGKIIENDPADNYKPQPIGRSPFEDSPMTGIGGAPKMILKAGKWLKPLWTGTKNATQPFRQATVSALKAPLPLGKTITNATAGKLNLGNSVAAYFGADALYNQGDSNSDVVKSQSNFINNPSWNTLGDAAFETGVNSLGFSGLGLGKQVFKPTYNASKKLIKGFKGIPKQLSGSSNTPIVNTKMGFDFGMDMSKYEIKNPDYFTQLLNTYDSKALSTTNKKFYKDLIKSVKNQNNIATERQYGELQRLKTGNFNFGKKGYANGGTTNDYIELDLTPEEIQKYKDGGYVVEELPEMQSGGSPSQVWYQYTGTPWSEARKKGLTDGSKEQNIKLRKKILSGEFGKPKFSNEKYQNIESNYDRNIKKMVAQGKTLDQLVKQKVGTRAGLKSRFPELFKTKSKLDDFLPKKNNSTSSKTQNKITTPVKNRWGNVTVESNDGKPIYRKDDYIDMVQSKDSKTKAEGLKMQAEHKKQLQAEKIKKQKKDLLNVEALLANAANAANTHKAQVKAIEAARVAKLSDEEKLYEYFLGKPAPAKVEPIKVEPIPGSMASQIKGDHNKKYYDDNGIEIKPILWDPDTSLWDMNKGLLEQKWFPFSEKFIESQKYKPEGFFKMFPDPSTKEAQAYLKAEQAKENAKKEEEDFQYREAMIKENPEISIEEIDQFIQDQKSIAYENSIAGPHNNYNDGPVQMVYPERVFAYGPSGGILGGLLRNPYVMGAGNLYFGAQGISEWADSDSDLRKSISRAYDDPTSSNIGDAAWDVSMNALHYIGLPFSKYFKNTRNATKIPKKYGPFKPRKPKTINLNQNPRWLQLPKYNSKGYLEFKKYQDGGNVSKLEKQKIDNYKLDKEIVSDLSKEEINKLVSQGYIVEQIN